MPPPSRNARQPLIFGILVLSLWSTITNLVPLSIVFVALLPLVPFALMQNQSMPRLVIALLVLYGYFIVSVLVYAPSSFLAPEFYRRDGNVFVTLLPLIIGGLLRIRTDVEQLVYSFLKWATLVNCAFIGIFAVTGSTLFITSPGTYHLLFEAHNAAGGYLAVLTALALGMYFGRRKSLPTLAMIIVNAVGLWLTISRGSVLALVLSIFLVLVLKERFKILSVAGMALVTAALLWFTYPIWVAYGKPAGVFLAEAAALAGTDLVGFDANLGDRMLFLWPRALDLFLMSPIVGTGFGSFDDLPYQLRGIPHVLSINAPIELSFSSAHAHHTYLHVLAETGLVGLGLLVIVLHQIWKNLESMELRSVELGLRLAFWTAIFSSATEHRLFTPSQMLPFTIIFGLVLARKRWTDKYGSEPPEPMRTGFGERLLPSSNDFRTTGH